jgi:hypothetical protein
MRPGARPRCWHEEVDDAEQNASGRVQSYLRLHPDCNARLISPDLVQTPRTLGPTAAYRPSANPMPTVSGQCPSGRCSRPDTQRLPPRGLGILSTFDGKWHRKVVVGRKSGREGAQMCRHRQRQPICKRPVAIEAVLHVYRAEEVQSRRAPSTVWPEYLLVQQRTELLRCPTARRVLGYEVVQLR